MDMAKSNLVYTPVSELGSEDALKITQTQKTAKELADSLFGESGASDSTLEI